jgi:hypothetical protein
MNIRRRRATQISATARAAAQRAPETLTLVRHRAQPMAQTIVRLAVTAVFAYLPAQERARGGQARPEEPAAQALLAAADAGRQATATYGETTRWLSTLATPVAAAAAAVATLASFSECTCP